MAPKSTLGVLALLVSALSLTACAPAPNNASDQEAKEFSLEDGVLFFPMTFEGATRIIRLEKLHG